MTFGWVAVSDRLLFREDDFSWQGAWEEDEMVFLRRSKDDPTLLTDVNLGNLAIDEAADALADFLDASTGLAPSDPRRLFLPVVNGSLSSEDVRLAMARALKSLGAHSVEFSTEGLPTPKCTVAAAYHM